MSDAPPAEDDAAEEETRLQQERTVFLIHATRELFEQTDGSADGRPETRLERCCALVLEFIKGELVGRSKNLVGLVACGEGLEGGSAKEVLPLDTPRASAARALQSALIEGRLKDVASFKEWLGEREDAGICASDADGALRNGFRRCARAFEEAPKRADALTPVYAFSAAADPCASVQEREVLVQDARDWADVGREVQLAHFGQDLAAFWDPLLEANAQPGENYKERAYEAAADFELYEANREKVSRASSRRKAKGLQLTLTLTHGAAAAKNEKIVVKRLALATKARKLPARVKFDRATMKQVKTTSMLFDMTTGAQLDKDTEVRTHVPVGKLGLEKDNEGEEALAKAKAHRSYVDQAELNEMAEEDGFLTDDVALLGRCRYADVFPGGPEVAMGEAFLLAPDDDIAPGSAAVVSALCAALGEGEVFLGRYAKAGRGTSGSPGPRLCVLRAAGGGLEGFELPFGDEARAGYGDARWPMLTSKGDPIVAEAPPEDEALDEAVLGLVDALAARCEPGGPLDMEAGIPNARLRVGEKMLEAAALDLGASALDKAWAEADAQLPAVTPEVDALLNIVRERLPEGTGSGAPPAKRRKVAEKEVPAELLKAPADRARLKEFGNKALQAACTSLGLSKTGTKDVLVNKIAERIENPPAED